MSDRSFRRPAAALGLSALVFAACAAGCAAEEDTIATILDDGERNPASNPGGSALDSVEAGPSNHPPADGAAAPSEGGSRAGEIADAGPEADAPDGSSQGIEASAEANRDSATVSDGGSADARSAGDAPSSPDAGSGHNW